MTATYLDEFLDQSSQTSEQKTTGDKMDQAVSLEERVIAQLKTIYDPEIPVNIYELGLIYGIDVADGGKVDVTMTLTTPMCPVAESMPSDVEAKVREIDGVSDVKVDLVWEPPWDMNMLTEAAKLELGML
ncbi:MAG: SUF system Fe-S cluster assembly protein [Proteobacteria bacterium]|nr:SUF system Fe-S cluster assembly protein [Pseudomonadota bacterium]